VAGSCEHGDESTGSIRGKIFLEELGDYQLLKNDPVTWSY
jgi:hypothetical protein